MPIRSDPYKKDLPHPLTPDEVREKSLQHIALLQKVDDLTEQKKRETKDINEQIKETQKQAKKLAKVVVDAIEVRSTDVWDKPDWETKRVYTLRKGPDKDPIVVEVRGMTHDEQQTNIPGTEDVTPKSVPQKPVEKSADLTQFRVELVELPEGKGLAIIKLIQTATGVTLGAAKSLAAQAPKVVLATHEQAKAEKLARDLEEAGATVTLHVPAPQPKALPPAKPPTVRKGKKDEAPPAALPDGKNPDAPATQEEVEKLKKRFRRNSGLDEKPKKARA